jgi:thioredoxin reductase/Pyruvate/2-oxoacid:ferredoxin oxidoreductase delta subunit
MIEFAIYAVVILMCAVIIWTYVRKLKKESLEVGQKIDQARELGIHEPVSLYPSINEDICIQSGACVLACPEKEIIGIRNGRATLINASRCVGHGACFHACPVEAITLKIGTEKRGVDLPHVNQNFETNMHGIYIAGELGGMGLIKNSVEQGRQAVDNIFRSLDKGHTADYDLVIVGAGPAGISASLQAKSHGMKTLTLEQDSLGGTVFSFPRAKVVMTSPMDLPAHGKVKLFQTSKKELLDLWQTVLNKNDVTILEHQKVESIAPDKGNFKVTTAGGHQYTANKVLIAIGRRGSPRKLGVQGENLEKVAYKLMEPEHITGQDILVVGGGDSAIETALLLASDNKVTLSYRGETFSRLKPGNSQRIGEAMASKTIDVVFESNVTEIEPQNVILSLKDGETITLANDLVYIFAGGELPTQFLQNAGINISKRFNYTMKSHRK